MGIFLLGVVILYFAIYTLTVSPKRFFQCLDAPIRYFQRFNGDETNAVLPPYLDGNQVELLVNGNEILPAMLHLIGEAEHSIRWQVMLFQPDEAGLELGAALTAAAQRGVQVQLSFDMNQTVYGSIAAPYPAEKIQQFERNMKAMRDKLSAAGAVLLDSPPGIDFALTSLSDAAREMQQGIMQAACISANHYDHRKILIVDDQQALIGGMNIGNEYLYHIAPDISHSMAEEAQERKQLGLPEAWQKWQDSAVLVEGPIVQTLIQDFNLRWEVLGGKPIAPPATFAAVGPTVAQVLSQKPGLHEISTRYLDLIATAQQQILVASPYVSHEKALMYFMEAAQRGVQVKFISPGDYNDVWLSRDIYRSYSGRLLNAGIEVYENNLRMAHSKVMVVDQRWTVMGSFNVNHRSFDHDFETVVVVDSPEFARQVIDRVFQPYLAYGTPITTPYKSSNDWLHWLIGPFT